MGATGSSESDDSTGLRVAVGFDGREGGADALALGRTLAPGEVLTITVVVPFPPGTVGEVSGQSERPANWTELCEALDRHGHELLREGVEGLDAADFEPVVILDDSAARGLARVAAERSIDVLALGSTHRGALGRVLAGSLPTRLLSGGATAVAIAPGGYADHEPAPLRKVWVGYDGAAEADRAVASAARVCRRHGAELVVGAVVEPARSLEYEFSGAALRDAIEVLGGQGLRDRRGEELRSKAERALAEVAAGVDASVQLDHGVAAEKLTALTPEDADLLILGSRGYGPLGRALLGSTSTEVVAGASLPVLVVPRPGTDP